MTALGDRLFVDCGVLDGRPIPPPGTPPEQLVICGHIAGGRFSVFHEGWSHDCIAFHLILAVIFFLFAWNLILSFFSLYMENLIFDF